MVICCAAANCSNRQGKGEKRAVSFHRFPLKDSKRLMQWLKAVQRDNWTPTKYSFLCSEHFTKDSFSKRLEDQHRLLKPTAVPSIFHLAEKKRGAGGHGRPRRRDTGRASAGLRAQASDTAVGKAAAGAPSSSSASPMAKPEPRRLKRAVPQGRTAARVARETAGQEWSRQPPEGRAEDGPASTATSSSQGEAGTGAVDAGDEGANPADGGQVDRSGVSADDFTPPGSGACKFIGSLHSYSFSSKHAREKPAVPREPVERKRLRRDAEPSHSGSSPGPEKGPAQSPPRACPPASSSLTATPQKPAQGASAPPTDVTPKPAAEAVQSEHSDASPMSINEVILSASGACKLIDSLHSYCFSSRQSKSQVCCLREQVEKKNGELRTLRQRVSRSDSQVRELRQKLDQLRRLSLPHLSSLLPPGREPPRMSPMVEPLSWMLGTWLSEPPGAGTFPTLQPFRYLEEAHISHVGQPMLNFSFSAFHPDTRKPMHRECGFIRLQPDTNKVAFVSAQNTGIVEVEEGEVNGQELCIASHSIARISFAKEPHVEQITRKFRLNSEGKLEQTVSMATTTQPLTQHLHVTYKKWNLPHTHWPSPRARQHGPHARGACALSHLVAEASHGEFHTVPFETLQPVCKSEKSLSLLLHGSASAAPSSFPFRPLGGGGGTAGFTRSLCLHIFLALTVRGEQGACALLGMPSQAPGPLSTRSAFLQPRTRCSQALDRSPRFHLSSHQTGLYTCPSR